MAGCCRKRRACLFFTFFPGSPPSDLTPTATISLLDPAFSSSGALSSCPSTELHLGTGQLTLPFQYPETALLLTHPPSSMLTRYLGSGVKLGATERACYTGILAAPRDSALQLLASLHGVPLLWASQLLAQPSRRALRVSTALGFERPPMGSRCMAENAGPGHEDLWQTPLG